MSSASDSDVELANGDAGATGSALPSGALPDLIQLWQSLEKLALHDKVDNIPGSAASSGPVPASLSRAIRHIRARRHSDDILSLPARVQRELALVTTALLLPILTIICPLDALGLGRIVLPRFSKTLTGGIGSPEDIAAARNNACGRKLLNTVEELLQTVPKSTAEGRTVMAIASSLGKLRASAMWCGESLTNLSSDLPCANDATASECKLITIGS